MQPLSPDELVRWCQRTLPDDPRGFEVLVAQYSPRVFSMTYRLMGNRQEAEDQAQEVFLKVYRGIKRLAEPATLPAWIDRITVNTCLDALAVRRRRPATQSLDPADAPAVADRGIPTPEEAALRREARRCIEEALSQLDPPTRAVLVLRDIHDQPYQEIADALSIGLSAVKMRIHRARLACQRLLEAVCPGVWSAQS